MPELGGPRLWYREPFVWWTQAAPAETRWGSIKALMATVEKRTQELMLPPGLPSSPALSPHHPPHPHAHASSDPLASTHCCLPWAHISASPIRPPGARILWLHIFHVLQERVLSPAPGLQGANSEEPTSSLDTLDSHYQLALWTWQAT